MRSQKRHSRKEKRKGPPPRSKATPKTVSSSHHILTAGYFEFLKRFSTSEKAQDKNRYQKVKLTSTDRFEECLLETKHKITPKHNTKQIVCGPIDGVDEILSLYASISSMINTKGSSTINAPCAVLCDINRYKIDYLTFRLILTQISDNREEYLRNLFFYLKGEKGVDCLALLDKAARNTTTKEIHSDYLVQKVKKAFSTHKNVRIMVSAIKKGVDMIHLERDGKSRYKTLAKNLKKNMLLNLTTHWLSDENMFLLVKEAFSKDNIKAFHANLNLGGKRQLSGLFEEFDADKVEGSCVPSVLYLPKGQRKFSGSTELVDRFEICIDTVPPQNKRDKFRVWRVLEPERFFTTPQFQHQGELSNRQLMLLTQDYKHRSGIIRRFNGRCNLMLLGDVPFGRLYLDERSRSFLKRIQEYANRYDVKHIALCGDIIDGEHAREKRKLALLQYLSDAPRPSIEQQCKMAAEFVAGFDGAVYSVASDGDWDIIEEKQRELINQKEFQYKIEKNTSHIPDNVRKSLRVEAVFEAAKEYYDYIENQINLSEKIGDSLSLDFDTANVSLTHMSIGQYFRRSLAKSVGVKEQQIINQFLAVHDFEEEKSVCVKVSSHDNVLQAHMETENTLNVKVPSLESPSEYEQIPVQLRSAVQDMMHKAFSVRGKIPFLSSCKVEVTDDGRILLTIVNEKLLEMLDKYRGKGAEEYLIFTLTDVHVGSIAHRYDYLVKYLDYVKNQSEKLQQKPNMKRVGRIALFNGDIIEGINYPTAMMRNSTTRLSFPQTQMACAIELMKPFFFTEKNGRIHLDKDIEHIVLTHGNHEYNSGFIHSGMMATQTLFQHFKAHMEREYTEEEVRRKLMYSLFVKVGRNKTLFTSAGAVSKLGLNIHMMHSYGGRPNLASATPPIERWVSKIGSLAKPWDILIQGHYHKFSLGEVAGKVLLTFPSFTEISDFEYERALDSPMCGTLLHLSSKYGLVVEILTRDFLEKYTCKHKMFEKKSIKRFYDECTEKAIEPADLSQFR